MTAAEGSDGAGRRAGRRGGGGDVETKAGACVAVGVVAGAFAGGDVEASAGAGVAVGVVAGSGEAASVCGALAGATTIGVVVQYASDRLAGARPAERRPPRQQLVEDDPEREEIAAVVHDQRPRLLRRDVARRAEERPLDRVPAVVELGDPEVRELRRPV